jgi:hypothetical protein
MRRNLGEDPGCGNTPGRGEQPPGGTWGWFGTWSGSAGAGPFCITLEGRGKAEGGREVGGERETLLLVIICQSLGGSSCHGTGWAGRGLQADSLR